MKTMFQQGDRVAVPLHGRAVVKAVESMTLPGGGEEICYVIALEGRRGGRLVIPASRAAEYGLRRPMGTEDVEGVMEVLARPVEEHDDDEQMSQAEFYKALKEEIRAGSAHALASVVRRLYAYGLTSAITDVPLKELERHAWDELVSELADAEPTTKATALRNIRSTLKHATPKEMLR